MDELIIRAGLYARISDDREGEELGVARQLKEERQLIQVRGGTVVLEREDTDISALKGKFRQGYEDIMAAAEVGLITHIVVWQLSRLWRNRRERAEGIERLARARVSVIAVKGPDLDMTTAYGRAMAGLLGEFDTMESEVKSERVLLKVAELAEAGAIANGGYRPFGYRRIYLGEGKRRKIIRDEIEESEAEIIRECAKKLLGGTPMRSIVKDLNERGIKTSTGGLWTMQAMRYMLRSGRIAGLRERNRKVVGPAVWPAIIDRETHEQLRALLDSKERAPGSRVRIHYLTGFVYCSGCVVRGVKMGVRRHPTTKKLKYSCQPKAEGGCGGRVIDLEELEKLVKLYMVGRLNDPKTLRELAARERKEDTRAAKLVELIEKDERRLARAKATMESEDVEEDEIPELVSSMRVIRARMADHRRELAVVGSMPGLPEESLPDLADRWDDLDLDRKQSLLRLFVDKILIKPHTPGTSTKFFDPNRVDIVPVGATRSGT